MDHERVRVLDWGWVELIDVLGNDMKIVNAARTSYLGDTKGKEADKKLLFYLMQHRHTTPFEMVEFTFRVRAPVVTAWQWVRHRTMSFNFSSGRYTEFKEEEGFYIPDDWRGQSKINKQASEGWLSGDDCAKLTEMLESYVNLGQSLYEQALEMGVAREQARLFLPAWGSYYTFYCKVDAHNLMHFLKLRMDLDAQYEIRVYADTIYKNFFKPLLPWTAEAFEKYILEA